MSEVQLLVVLPQARTLRYGVAGPIITIIQRDPTCYVVPISPPSTQYVETEECVEEMRQYEVEDEIDVSYIK
ncbi:unnamed protein product [Anisakis simplex]|uniref:Usp domain-containing protein n=1 Tax=Anisakis simplex TaxID=6269 RepID=A0A0M3JJR7_ANISI|nr:unnamed protein product [Anisakis simplex]